MKTTTKKQRISQMVIPSITSIEQIVCNEYNMQVSSLNIRTRKREIKEARQICMWWMVRNTKESYASIGARYADENGKPFDHATVSHAKRTINNLIETDKLFRKRIELIEQRADALDSAIGNLKQINNLLEESRLNLSTIEIIFESSSEEDELFTKQFWSMYYEIFINLQNMAHLVRHREKEKAGDFAA